MEEESPNKMMDSDKIPEKNAASRRSNTKVSKKDRKSPPEAAVQVRNMSSDDGSEYGSDGDKGRDRNLERAQQNAPF